MSWEQVKLGDIFEIARGGSPRPIDQYITDDPNGLNWISIKDASNSSKYIYKTEKKIKPEGLHKTRLVHPNDFLLTNSMSFGRPYIMKTTGCIHDGWLVLSADKTKVDTDYFYHLLGSDFMYRKFKGLAAGAVVKNLNTELVKSVSVPLPPLAEQRRIASILDQADDLRQKRQQAIEKLDQLLQATFIDMFGDPIDNLKGLETVALLDLCKKVTDGTHQSPKWTTEGIPFLFISNIVDGEIDYSSQKFIDQVTYDSLTKSTKIELNDILYTTVGSYGNVARVKSNQLFCFQRHIAHIKPNFDKVNPKFLEKMLSSYGVRRQADRLVRGVAQKTLNLKDLKEIIVFNISLDEQNYFVQKCEVIESLKIKSKLALNQADDLFKSLQNQAFNGTSFENLRYKDSYEI